MKKITRKEYQDLCDLHNKRGIGGSHVAGIVLPEAKYSSQFKVWKECVFGRNFVEMNEFMQRGLDKESSLIDKFIELNPDYETVDTPELVQHKDYWYMVSAIDSLIKRKDSGILEVLEIKTTSIRNLDEYDNEGVPDHYLYQVLHYLSCSELKNGNVFVGFYDDDNNLKQTRLYSIDVDEEDLVALADTISKFWNNYVETETPPPIDGSEATKDSIDSLIVDGSNIEATTQNLESIIVHYKNYKEQIKLLEELTVLLSNKIKVGLGHLGKQEIGNYTVNLRNQTTQRFDTKKYQEEHPVEYTNYLKSSSFVVLDIRNKK